MVGGYSAADPLRKNVMEIRAVFLRPPRVIFLSYLRKKASLIRAETSWVFFTTYLTKKGEKQGADGGTRAHLLGGLYTRTH